MNIFSAVVACVMLAIGGGVVYQGVRGENILSNSEMGYPLSQGEKREKKLTFGLFVTPDPETNPIDPPERFTGYHTALDLEIFPKEEMADVPVFAACDGKILRAETLSGYGGVIIQSCRVENYDVTVLYGHLDYHRFQTSEGQEVKKGKQIAFLGDGKSPESGNTRKHLHFSIHKGREIEVRGYVEKEAELEPFIDPSELLPNK